MLFVTIFANRLRTRIHMHSKGKMDITRLIPCYSRHNMPDLDSPASCPYVQRASCSIAKANSGVRPKESAMHAVLCVTVYVPRCATNFSILVD
jgi:hypothetical protein